MAFHRPDPVAGRLEALDFSRTVAAQLSLGGTLLDVRPGSTLCTEGERGLQAFLILEGTAEVLATEAVITVGPGAVVGEMATLDQRRTRNATVIAQTDLLVLVFDARAFRALAGDAELNARLSPDRLAA